MELRYSTGAKETVEFKRNANITEEVAREVIETAHRTRHWSHGVLSVNGQRGVAAEQVYALISSNSFETSNAPAPHALPVPQETIFEALRRLCREPRSVAALKARGDEKHLRQVVAAIVWPDGDAPVVESASETVKGWAK